MTRKAGLKPRVGRWGLGGGRARLRGARGEREGGRLARWWSTAVVAVPPWSGVQNFPLGYGFNGTVHGGFDAPAQTVVFEDCSCGFQGRGWIDGSFTCQIVCGTVNGLVFYHVVGRRR